VVFLILLQGFILLTACIQQGIIREIWQVLTVGLTEWDETLCGNFGYGSIDMEQS
jgi:hypothetical protein